MVHSTDYFQPSSEAMCPSLEMQERILYECEKEYAGCVWSLDDDFDSFEAFERALRRLDMTSSPGFPYQREAPTNGDWLKWNGVEVDEIQKQRLWFDVQLVMRDQWEHIIRVFIKQEPHKLAKVESGRWRLIMASSLPVQMLWHMLFDDLNDLEIKNSYDIPSQQGIILVAGGWKRYHAAWKELGLTCGVDKSSWDWTAPFWAIMLDLELRRRLGRGDRLQEWITLAKLLYRHMFEIPTLMLSDGQTFKQIVPGIMKSGCVNTISTNSHCQVFLHLAVCLDANIRLRPFPRACGDDTIHHVMHTNHLDLYKRYGVQIKEVSDELIEFVGHEFHDDGPRPMYILKHLKKLRYVSDDVLPQYLDSMARMYVHTDHFYFWERLARALRCPLPLSREAYSYWYDFAF